MQRSDGLGVGKRRLDILAPSAPKRTALDLARDEARALDEAGARARFEVEGGRALKTTVSLCPECLAHVPALVFERCGCV